MTSGFWTGGKLNMDGATISYHDINLSVSVKEGWLGIRSETKTILNGLSGVMRPGVNAVVGPTGSGKTSHDSSATLSGKVLLNGNEVKGGAMRRCTGYVVQDDVIMGTLTVRENISFSAHMRLPADKYSYQKRMEKVGNEFRRGVSGGERKRTAIAIELITDPVVLFLDEPTTGLDANTAVAIVQLLSELGNDHRTIIMSIHQPRYSIFTLFDHLVILSRGQTAYNGPAASTVDYFSSIGFICPRYHNPADYFLDVVNGEVKQQNDDKETKPSICTKQSTSGHELVTIQPAKHDEKRTAVGQLLVGIYSSSQMAQEQTIKLKLYYVTKRTCTDLIRNPMTSLLPIILASLIGFIVGLIFFKLEPLHIGIQGRHESAAGYYRTSAYFIARVVADLVPNRWIPIFFLSAISYFMIGFQLNAGKFFFYYLSIALSGTTAASMAFAVSSSFQVYGVATLFLTVPCFVMMLFGGFLINTAGILPWLEWLKYFSIMRYGMNGILVNELSGLVFTDNHSLLDHNSANPCFIEALNYTLPDCKTGYDYLRHQQIPCDTWGVWQNVVALGTMTSFFLILSYVQLRRTRKFR